MIKTRKVYGGKRSGRRCQGGTFKKPYPKHRTSGTPSALALRKNLLSLAKQKATGTHVSHRHRGLTNAEVLRKRAKRATERQERIRMKTIEQAAKRKKIKKELDALDAVDDHVRRQREAKVPEWRYRNPRKPYKQ